MNSSGKSYIVYNENHTNFIMYLKVRSQCIFFPAKYRGAYQLKNDVMHGLKSERHGILSRFHYAQLKVHNQFM